LKYLLDTNTCIQCLRTKGSPLVKARLAAHSSADIALAAVTLGELLYGAERGANPAKALAQTDAFIRQFVCLPVDEAVARVYAPVRADLASQGQSIGPNDTLIAAVALTHGLILVTHNTKEFSRIPTLTLEDWEVP
jgi:tRNA(fMet)-specific endonuclease VapC